MMTLNIPTARESLKRVVALGFDIPLAGHSTPVLGNTSGKVKRLLDFG